MLDSAYAAQARLHTVFQGVFGAVALLGLVLASITWRDNTGFVLTMLSCLLIVGSQTFWTRFFSAVEVRLPVGRSMLFAQVCWYAGIAAAALATVQVAL